MIKYACGLINEVRTKGLWTGGAMVGLNAAAEGASDHLQKQAKSQIKHLVVPPDPKAKPKDEDTLQDSMLDKVKEEAGLAPVSDL